MFYKIRYFETVFADYCTEAVSEEEAREKVRNMAMKNPPENYYEEGMEILKWNEEDVLDYYANKTEWFDGTVTRESMYDMFRNRMCFGEAESNVLLAALEFAGAKWKKEE